MDPALPEVVPDVEMSSLHRPHTGHTSQCMLVLYNIINGSHDSDDVTRLDFHVGQI